MKKTLIFASIGCIILIGAPFIVFAQECFIDSDCPSGQICSGATCTTSLLPYGSTCTSNSQCASNYCNPITGGCGCTTNAHCLSGEICTNARVCARDLSSLLPYNSNCSSNSQCESNFCDPIMERCGCTTNANCPSGQTCNSSRVCVSGGAGNSLPYGSNCSTDSQCASGFCEPLDGVLTCLCQDDSDCPSGLPNCNITTNECNNITSGNVHCWVVTQGGTEYYYQYDNEAECRSECQSFDCEFLNGDDCLGWCCNAQDENAQNVTCGGSSNSGGSATIPNPLKCEDIPCVVDAITSLITSLVTVLGTIMIIIGGIQYISSAGSEDKARRAKNTVLYAVIGIAIAISVDFIVGFLREILSRNN